MHLSTHIPWHVPSYPTNNEFAYTWQGDGPGGGHRVSYPVLNHLGGSFSDQAGEPLHAIVDQITADIKELAGCVSGLCEREAEWNEEMKDLLTHIKAIETRLDGFDGTIGEGTKTRGGRSTRGRGVSNEHPQLKVSGMMLVAVPLLKTSACCA